MTKPQTRKSDRPSTPPARITISSSVPTEWAALIVEAGKQSHEPDLSAYVAKRLIEVAAAELNVDVPVLAAPEPKPPSRDRLRYAAKAAGMSEDAFKAKALEDAVREALRTTMLPPPVAEEPLPTAMPATAKPPSQSGEYRLWPTKSTIFGVDVTPAQAFRAGRTG